MKAIFPGTCSVCGGSYVPRNDEIDYTGKTGPRGGKLTAHVQCLSGGKKKKAKKNPTFRHPVTKKLRTIPFYPTQLSDSLLESDDPEAAEIMATILRDDLKQRRELIAGAALDGLREYDVTRGKWMKRHIEGPKHKIPNGRTRRGKR